MTIIKNGADSSSFIQAGTGFSQIASGPNSVTSTNDSGTFINGPLSISSTPGNVKIGGIFRLNPALATCIPSTMVTPIPTLIIDLPLRNLSSMMIIGSMVASVL